MSNNPILFNAAVSGVYGGINTSRSLVSAVALDYAAQATNAAAFATLVDAAIAAGSFSQQDADMLTALVQEVVSGKGSAGLNLTSAAAIAAAFTQGRTALEAGGGSATNPLSTVRYVDVGTTVPAASRNGSQSAPFATIQAAVDNLGATVGTIYIAPGTYPEAVSTAVGHQFIGMTSNRAAAALPAVTSITTTGTAGMNLSLLAVATVTAVAGVIASLCSLGTVAMTVATTLTLTQCTVGAFTAGSIANSTGSTFNGAITLTTAAGISRFSGGNQFLAAADITGPGGTSQVIFDAESMSRFRSVGNTLTTVNAVNVQSRAGMAQVTVAVPALAAATTGEVAVNVSAIAELAGVTTAELVVANPPVAALAPGVGLNNGGYMSCRVTATNVITFTFIGALTGGNVTFLVARPCAIV